MQFEIRIEQEKRIALLAAEEPVITDTGSALEVIMAVRHEAGAERLAVRKSALCEEFFHLRTGLAGEILQKFINYQVKVAIYGDYSLYKSKALRDFFYESNQGKDIFFTAAEEEAIERLANA